MYSPENFGVYSIFMAVSSLLSIIMLLRLDVAVLQPKTLREAMHVYNSCIYLGIITTAILFIGIIIIVDVLNVQFLAITLNADDYIIYLLPIAALLISLYNLSLNVMTKKGMYINIGVVKSINSTLTAIISLGLGLISSNPSNLIIGLLVGYSLSILYQFYKLEYFAFFKKYNSNGHSLRRLILYIEKYKNYYRIDLPSALMNSFAINLPVALIGSYFGSAYSGYYYMILKLLNAPISLISSSVGVVYRKEAVDYYHKNGIFKPVYIKTFKILTLLSIGIFFPIYFLSDWAITQFMGDKWYGLEKYIVILLPMFFMKFIVSPLSFSFYVADKMKYDLWGQAFYVLSVSFSMYYSKILKNVDLAFILLMMSGVMTYILYLSISYKVSYVKN